MNFLICCKACLVPLLAPKHHRRARLTGSTIPVIQFEPHERIVEDLPAIYSTYSRSSIMSHYHIAPCGSETTRKPDGTVQENLSTSYRHPT